MAGTRINSRRKIRSTFPDLSHLPVPGHGYPQIERVLQFQILQRISVEFFDFTNVQIQHLFLFLFFFKYFSDSSNIHSSFKLEKKKKEDIIFENSRTKFPTISFPSRFQPRVRWLSNSTSLRFLPFSSFLKYFSDSSNVHFSFKLEKKKKEDHLRKF